MSKYLFKKYLYVGIKTIVLRLIFFQDEKIFFYFRMEDIVSVTVYKQFGDLTGERKNKKKDLFDPEGVRYCCETKTNLDNIFDNKIHNGMYLQKFFKELKNLNYKYLCTLYKLLILDIPFISDSESLIDSDAETVQLCSGTSVDSALLGDFSNLLLSQNAATSISSLSGSDSQLPSIEEEDKQNNMTSLKPHNANFIVMKEDSNKDITLKNKPILGKFKRL